MEERLVTFGESADLSVLRKVLETPETIRITTEQYLEEDETIFCPWTSVFISRNDNRVAAKVLISSARIFVCAEKIQDQASDVVIDAQGILLHALSDEPAGVYLQVTESNGDDDDLNEDSAPIEFLFEPTNTEVTPEICQSLFDGFTQLVAENPTNEEPDQNPFGAMMNMMMGNTNDDEEMIVSDDLVVGGRSEKEATEEERRAALDRLDDMLVVPPEYEIEDEADEGEIDGQFDDADDDYDAL